MPTKNSQIPLPKSWPINVRTAILHVISLAQFATARTRLLLASLPAEWDLGGEWQARHPQRDAYPKERACSTSAQHMHMHLHMHPLSTYA